MKLEILESFTPAIARVPYEISRVLTPLKSSCTGPFFTIYEYTRSNQGLINAFEHWSLVDNTCHIRFFVDSLKHFLHASEEVNKFLIVVSDLFKKHCVCCQRISILGWFNYRKYVIASTGKVLALLKESECAQMFFSFTCSFAHFLSVNQSINFIYPR